MAVNFDGANDYYSITSTLGISDYPFLFHCCFRDTSGAADDHNLVELSDFSVNPPDMVRLTNSDSTANTAAIVARAAPSTTGHVEAGAAHTGSVWTNAQGLFLADADKTIYTEGGNSIRNTDNVPFDADIDTFSVGVEQFNSTQDDFWAGDIAEVAVYGGSLTQAIADEIAARLGNWESPLLVFPHLLIEYWPFYTTGNQIGLIAGTSLTESGTPVQAEHPPVINPHMIGFQLGVAAAGGGEPGGLPPGTLMVIGAGI